MKQIYLVRHGEAEHLLQGIAGGWTDSDLTELGHEQARRTGIRLQKLFEGKPINFYCSDLQRARKTAELIGQPLMAVPKVVHALRELNNGIAANKSKEEIEKLRIPMTEPVLDWIPYPEAESWNMMRKRIYSFMAEISDDSHDTTLIVTHANSSISIMQWWLALPDDVIARTSFKAEPCSISQLMINSWGEKIISKLNDTCHLEFSH
ncbi:MAG: protein containing Phosphoglycerate mutase domain [Bacilli bacterium]|nr:protein containing Phosphoglycerate mutase domain [Bacilli bacterium]